MLAPVEVTPRLSKAFRYSKATDLRCSSVIICFVTAILQSERNATLVLRQPLVERLELRIQLLCDVRASSSDDMFFEISIDLEHIAHFVGSLEAEATVCIRFDGIVLDLSNAETFTEFVTHFAHRQVLAGDADSLPDMLLARFEDPIRNLADVFGGHSGELRVSQRERPT